MLIFSQKKCQNLGEGRSKKFSLTTKIKFNFLSFLNFFISKNCCFSRGMSCSLKKWRSFFFSFFRKSYTFLFLITCRKNFFEKIFSFCYFFHFLSFLLILDKNEQKLDHFWQNFRNTHRNEKKSKNVHFSFTNCFKTSKMA